MKRAAVRVGFYGGLPVGFLAACIPQVRHYSSLDGFVTALTANLHSVGTVASACSLDDWLDQLSHEQLQLLHEFERSYDEAKRQVLRLVVYLFMMLMVGGRPVDEQLIEDAHRQASQRIAAEVEVG